MTGTTSDVRVDIERSDRFTEQVVEQDNCDPFGYLTVTVDESYLVGSDQTHVGVWLTDDLTRLLVQTEAVVADERDVLTFYNGPSYLVVEPTGERADTVAVTHFLQFAVDENPKDRLPMEETFTVSKRDWVAELVRVAESHYETVVELNPSLRTHEGVSGLRSEIGRAKERRKRYEAD